MTEEDEAFEDLAKRQGDWGMQGSRKHQIMRYAENVESKGTSMTPQQIEVLKQALAAANLNERHQTIAESYYWLRQYKLLAEKAIAELESQEPAACVHIKDGCLVGSHRDQSKPFPDGQYGLWPINTHPPQRTEPLIGCVNHDCALCKEKNT